MSDPQEKKPHGDDVDWHAQWETYAYRFFQGKMHLDLADFGHASSLEIVLIPGPGFGDLSHPTTRAALRLLIGQNPQGCVLDIGSGSGILSLAAGALGAQKVHGFDIDIPSILHATDNARLNRLEEKISFSLPGPHIVIPPLPLLIVMNMISSEQKIAWGQLRHLHHLEAEIITSGVLQEERDSYVAECQARGWILLQEHLEDGWVAMVWKAAPPKNY